jgi:2-methylcitrate dehydratase PrpD
VVLDARMSLRRDDQACARVVVKLKDGRRLSEDTYSIRGDAANPVPRQELLDKFMFLTSDILGEQKAQEVIEAIDYLEEMSNIQNLTSLLGG